MELKDTVFNMVSSNYMDRFKAEYSQLVIRGNKLNEMVKLYKNGTLNFTPKTPISLLEKQLAVMREYREILIERANIEGVNLDE